MPAGSGNNHNMNHIVKRIETRVLAPPGGHSSLSFSGGYSSSVPRGGVARGKKTANKEALRAQASKELLERYARESGPPGDSLDTLVGRSGASRHDGAKNYGADGSIPGLEKHYQKPADISPRSHHRKSPTKAAVSSRDISQRVEYADSLQQQIMQKKELDRNLDLDPYSNRRSLHRNRVQSNNDKSSSEANWNILPGDSSNSCKKSSATSSHLYAQQLQEQIATKKDLDVNAFTYKRKVAARVKSPLVDSSHSSLSQIGGGESDRKQNHHNNARQYAQQLQSQIAAKNSLQYNNENSGVYCDKNGNRVGNRIAVNKRRNVDNENPNSYDSFLG